MKTNETMYHKIYAMLKIDKVNKMIIDTFLGGKTRRQSFLSWCKRNHLKVPRECNGYYLLPTTTEDYEWQIQHRFMPLTKGWCGSAAQLTSEYASMIGSTQYAQLTSRLRSVLNDDNPEYQYQSIVSQSQQPKEIIQRQCN